MNKIVKFLNPFTMKHMVKLNPCYIKKVGLLGLPSFLIFFFIPQSIQDSISGFTGRSQDRQMPVPYRWKTFDILGPAWWLVPNPSEKTWTSKWGSSSPIFRVKIKNIWVATTQFSFLKAVKTKKHSCITDPALRICRHFCRFSAGWDRPPTDRI